MSTIVTNAVVTNAVRTVAQERGCLESVLVHTQLCVQRLPRRQPLTTVNSRGSQHTLPISVQRVVACSHVSRARHGHSHDAPSVRTRNPRLTQCSRERLVFALSTHFWSRCSAMPHTQPRVPSKHAAIPSGQPALPCSREPLVPSLSAHVCGPGAAPSMACRAQPHAPAGRSTGIHMMQPACALEMAAVQAGQPHM
ncbi:hypothetical protein B0H17DRAFT_1067092 [Mycena rosella]|uniref:Uncharacterized protein n=1 Tax=Mycena rosella TaxID=1033263 RepID=A0AAD7DDT0_MYCRO|nr:hypothetical protein B0H17DRAFT_1067092 [Mycena rosella]